MAHFAKVLDGKVLQTIVAEPEFFDTFVDTSPGEWIQTSYNTRGGVHYDPNTGEPSADQSKALRKNFGGPGMVYDRERDAFYWEQPFPSWTLDENTCWYQPPTPRPSDNKNYSWNEETLSWVEKT